MDAFNPVIAAHKRSSNHRDELLKSKICGCFYCLEIFPPQEIEDWIDNDQCALCPKCAVDSIIGSASNFPITKEFLIKMHGYWFENIKLSEL